MELMELSGEPEIIGHLVEVGLEDEEIPIEDILRDLSIVSRSAVVSIFSADRLLFKSVFFLRMRNGVFSYYVPISHGKPVRVTLDYAGGTELSGERVMYAKIFAITRREQEEANGSITLDC